MPPLAVRDAHLPLAAKDNGMSLPSSLLPLAPLSSSPQASGGSTPRAHTPKLCQIPRASSTMRRTLCGEHSRTTNIDTSRRRGAHALIPRAIAHEGNSNSPADMPHAEWPRRRARKRVYERESRAKGEGQQRGGECAVPAFVLHVSYPPAAPPGQMSNLRRPPSRTDQGPVTSSEHVREARDAVPSLSTDRQVPCPRPRDPNHGARCRPRPR